MKNLCYKIIICLLLGTGCTSAGTISTAPEESGVKYSIIYMIHADANYLYHEDDGTARRADEEVLKEARQIGENASTGEVFIFRQLPERKFLWLFPKNSRELLLYRNGKLAGKQKYAPGKEPQVFMAESGLYQNYSTTAGKQSVPQYFLYFGHEIPEEHGRGYHHSLPDIPMDVNHFAEGMKSFLPESSRFSMAILSTCNNGTSQSIKQLVPITDFVVASPQNLHLSHIDTDALALLENARPPHAGVLAGTIAENTFQRLSKTIQTAITLSVYNTEQVKSYLSEMNKIYQDYSDTADQNIPEDNIDCAAFPFFRNGKYTTGVQTWFQPAKFGPNSSAKTHSGWGCRPQN